MLSKLTAVRFVSSHRSRKGKPQRDQWASLNNSSWFRDSVEVVRKRNMSSKSFRREFSLCPPWQGFNETQEGESERVGEGKKIFRKDQLWGKRRKAGLMKGTNSSSSRSPDFLLQSSKFFTFCYLCVCQNANF